MNAATNKPRILSSALILVLLPFAAGVSAFRPQATDTFPGSATMPELIDAISARGEDRWLALAELATRGTPAIDALLDRLRADPPGYLTQISTGDSRPSGGLVYIGAAARPAVVRRLSQIVFAPGSTAGAAYASPPRGKEPDEAMALFDILWKMGPDSVPFLLEVAERSPQFRFAGLLEIRRMAYEPDIRLAFSPPPIDRAAFAQVMSRSMPRLLALMRIGKTDFDTPSFVPAYLVGRYGNAAERREAVTNLRAKEDLLLADPVARSGFRAGFGQSLETLADLGAPEAADPLMAVWLSRGKRIDGDTVRIARALHQLRDVRYREPLIAALAPPAERSKDTSRFERFHALHLAGTSHDLALVPYLIDLLDDPAPASSPFTEFEADSRSLWAIAREQVKTMGGAAHQALCFLTMQEIGLDAAAWRKWWEANRDSRWEDVVRRWVEQRVAESATASPGKMNRWMMDAFVSADPLVLPFVDGYLARPDIDPTARERDEGRPTGSSDGNRMYTPAVVRLLAALDRDGVVAARPRLYRCLEAHDYRIRQWAALQVSFFDRAAATESLARDLPAGDGWVSIHAAETLLWMGDGRAVPFLISHLGTPDPPGLDVARFGSPETTFRDAACRVLHQYTTAPLRCESRSPAERIAVADAWQRWWRANAKTFQARTRRVATSGSAPCAALCRVDSITMARVDGFAIDRPREPRGVLRFSHEAMATVFEVYAVHPDERYASQAAHAAFELVDRLEADLSRFVPNSDIARVNDLAAGTVTRVTASTLECLQIARHMFDLTGGAFDVSIGTGLPSLDLDPHDFVVRAATDGVRIDLGGIGKGYAVDLMAECLEEWAVRAALVHGGFSSVLALDGPAGGVGWPLTFSDPGNPSRVLERISAKQVALGASGLRKGHHIVDPRTGNPVRERLAAWVAVPRPRHPANAGSRSLTESMPRAAAVADALTTAFMILGADEIEALWRRAPEFEAWLLRRPETAGGTTLLHVGSVAG